MLEPIGRVTVVLETGVPVLVISPDVAITEFGTPSISATTTVLPAPNVSVPVSFVNVLTTTSIVTSAKFLVTLL